MLIPAWLIETAKQLPLIWMDCYCDFLIKGIKKKPKRFSFQLCLHLIQYELVEWFRRKPLNSAITAVLKMQFLHGHYLFAFKAKYDYYHTTFFCTPLKTSLCSLSASAVVALTVLIDTNISQVKFLENRWNIMHNILSAGKH